MMGIRRLGPKGFITAATAATVLLMGAAPSFALPKPTAEAPAVKISKKWKTVTPDKLSFSDALGIQTMPTSSSQNMMLSENGTTFRKDKPFDIALGDYLPLGDFHIKNRMTLVKDKAGLKETQETAFTYMARPIPSGPRANFYLDDAPNFDGKRSFRIGFTVHTRPLIRWIFGQPRP